MFSVGRAQPFEAQLPCLLGKPLSLSSPKCFHLSAALSLHHRLNSVSRLTSCYCHTLWTSAPPHKQSPLLLLPVFQSAVCSWAWALLLVLPAWHLHSLCSHHHPWNWQGRYYMCEILLNSVYLLLLLIVIISRSCTIIILPTFQSEKTEV